jgi:hypothetical protein
MIDGSAKKLSVRFAVGSAAPTRTWRVFVDDPSSTVWVASDGPQVATWRLQEGAGPEGAPALRPRSVLTTRSASGTAFVGRIGAGEEEPATAVLGRDRSLTVWEGEACVGKKGRATSWRPERAALLSDGLHLAVAGSSSDVEIVSVGLLSVALALPPGHGSWLCAMCALAPLGSNRLERRPPVLFTASRDGLAVFWSVDLAGSNAIPVTSFALDPASPAVAARVSSDAKVLAVVFDSRVDLYKTLKV